jgi:hypothetical protein
MQSKAFPLQASKRLSIPPIGATTSAASQPVTEKKQMGLWQKANIELPRTEEEKDLAKQEREEQVAQHKEDMLRKEREEAAAKAAEKPAATQKPPRPVKQPVEDEDAIIEGGEDDDDDDDAEGPGEKPAPEKAKPRAKRPAPLPAKKQAASEAPHMNGAPAKLTDAQINHLNHIYDMQDMLRGVVNTFNTCSNALFGVMPALGMLDQLNQMGNDQLLGAPMNGRYRQLPQQIAWGPQTTAPPKDEDDESDSEAETGGKKRSKKQPSRPAKKPAKEDKYAAKNILSDDGEEAALSPEEAHEFMQKINKEVELKIADLNESNIKKKFESTTSNIRGFFRNNGIDFDKYSGKDRALVLSLAAYIRTMWPHLIADPSKPDEKGNSRAHILNRVAKAHPATLTDKTAVGALIKRDGLTRVFIEAFANVIAYYYIFHTISGVSVEQKAE